MSETEMPSKNPLPLAKASDSDEGEESKNKKSSTGYFKSFKPYDQRSCSDVLCLIILIVCFVVWLIVLGVSAMLGKPEVLYRATDYKGNVCGGTQYTAVAGEFPTNLATAKVGVMPRLIDDFITESYRTYSTSSLSMPVVTTMCAEKCPVVNDVFCDYAFLNEMHAKLGANGIWQTNPLQGDAKDKVRSALQQTADVNRAAVQLQLGGGVAGSALALKCGTISATVKPDSYKGSAAEFCTKVFFACDRIIVDTKPVLGRCVPEFAADEKEAASRCVDPVTSDPCNTTSEFDVNCIEAEKPYKAFPTAGFVPAISPLLKDGNYLFTEEQEKECSRLENRLQTTSEDIPQMKMLEKITKAASSFSNYVTSVQKAWLQVFICGLILPMIIGFIFLQIIGKLAGCIVWSCIILLEVCFIAGSLVFLQKAGVISLPGQVTAQASSTFAPVDAAQSQYYQIAGWVFTLFAVVFFCVILFLRSAIVDAIRVIRISAKAVTKNASILMWPLFSFFWIGVFSAMFCIIGVLLMSSGDMIVQKIGDEVNGTKISLSNGTSTEITMMKTNEAIKYLGLFDLFMWVWLCEFVQAIGIFTIGGDVAEWYFTDDNTPEEPEPELAEGEKRPCCHRCKKSKGVCGAFCHTFHLHLGTAAFGSLVITIVKLIKWWLAYTANEIQQANPDNKLLKYALRCVMCIVHCFEKCVKYLSKNAYIYSTIKGTSFCWSSYKSFVMLWNNFTRFGATGVSSAVVMLFGKISIMMLSTLAAYYAIELNAEFRNIQSENYISSMGQFVITFVVFCMSYIVAEIFFSVYDIATDSIMLCYCFDVEDGGGEAFAQKMGFELDVKKTKEDDEHEGEGGIGCCACLPCCKKSAKTDGDE